MSIIQTIFGGESKSRKSSISERQKSDVIINSIDDAVLLVDSSNVVQIFNPAASKLSGWQGSEAIGLDYRSIIKFTDEKNTILPDSQNPIALALNKGTPQRNSNAIIMSKNQQYTPVDISVTPLFSNSTITSVVAIMRDVREQRRQDKQRADFISTASHEMRTPVAAIEGYLALALNAKVAKIDAKARSYLERAHESTQHLGKLFQDLLTSAKADDGRLTSHPQVVEMGEFIENLVEDLKFSAEKKGLLIELLMGSQQRMATNSVDVSKKVIKPFLYALVDPDRLREAITNLFDNAVKYTESGRVSVGITGDESVIQIHIADTGPGIPPNDIPHLFQKFYRVDNSATRVIGGTGLGLYITRKIVELYNGRIWVESEVGKGSTFYINLPRLSTSKATAMLKQQNNVIQPIVQNNPQ